MSALAWGIGALAGNLLGGVAGNIASAKQAKLNREFQERMSSSAHQREVADLRKAGLNPILSATGGSGASTPGGSTAAQKNPLGDVSSALQLKAQIQLLNAQATNAKASANATDANSFMQKKINAGFTIGQTGAETLLSDGPMSAIQKFNPFARARGAFSSDASSAKQLKSDANIMQLEPAKGTSSKAVPAKQTYSGWVKDFREERGRDPTPAESYRYYWKYH